MKRNSLFTKIAALMLCVMMVIGCLPMSAFAAWEGEILVEPTYKDLTIGDNELTVYTGMAETIYTYTATAEGTLSITMPNYIGWSYELKNGEAVVAESSTTAEYPDAQPSVEVKTGDVVTLTVETNGPTKPVATTIYAAFSHKEGSDANPINVDTPWGGSYTIAAGETLYFAVYSFMGQWSGNMTISSEAPFVAYVNGRMPALNGVPVAIDYNAQFGREVLFNITNTSEADADYSISFETPIGTMDNPADLNVGTVDAKGENSAASEYVFAYSVEEAGTITIEMTSKTWFYSIEKIDGLTLVSTSTGETWSDDEGASATVTYDVVVGDSIKVLVQPYSADEVTFNAWFEAEAEEPEETDPPATEEPVETVPVAMIGETGYATVAEALNAAEAGQTVTMVADSGSEDKPEGTLIIKPEVTLDLASFDLHAQYVIGLSDSVIKAIHYQGADNVNQPGKDYAKLYVKQANISLDAKTVNYNATYKYIPVWTGDYYVIGTARITDHNSKTDNMYTFDKDNGTAKFTFISQFHSTLRSEVLPDASNEGAGKVSDNDISVIISMTYDLEGIKVTTNYFWTEPLQGGVVEANGLICDISECNKYDDLKFQISIVSNTGVTIATDIIEY